MSPARRGPRPTISTHDLLEAIATRGPRWTAAFPDADIVTINEAIDREQFAGNVDGHELTDLGWKDLRQLRSAGEQHHGRIDLRIDHACAAHDPCWVIRCDQCDRYLSQHVSADELEETVLEVIDAHDCPAAS